MAQRSCARPALGQIAELEAKLDELGAAVDAYAEQAAALADADRAARNRSESATPTSQPLAATRSTTMEVPSQAAKQSMTDR